MTFMACDIDRAKRMLDGGVDWGAPREKLVHQLAEQLATVRARAWDDATDIATYKERERCVEIIERLFAGHYEGTGQTVIQVIRGETDTVSVEVDEDKVSKKGR